MILKARISEWMPLSLESHYVGCEGGEPANLDPSSKHFTLIIIHMKLLDVLTESSFWLTWQATNLLECCLHCGPEREATYNYVAILLTLREPCLISSIDWDDSDLFTVGPGGNKIPPGKEFSVRYQATMHEIPWHLTVLLIYSEGKHQMAHFWDLTLSFARKTDTVLLPIPTWFLTFLEVWPAGNRFFCGGCILSELFLPILKMFRPTLAK